MSARSARASWSGPAVAAVSGLTGKGVQFVALTGLALVVSPAQFGLFSLVQALVFGVASLSASAFAVSAASSTARRRVDASRDGAPAATETAFDVLAGVLRGRRRWFGVVAVVDGIVVSAGLALVYGHPDHAVAAFLVGFAAAGITVTDTVVGALAGSGRPLTTAVVDGSRGVVGGLLAVVGGLAGGAIGAAAGLVVLDAAIAVVVLIVTAGRGRATVRAHRPAAEEARGGSPEPVPIAEASSDAVRSGEHGRRVTLTGVSAASLGQIAPWVLLWALQAVGGLEAVATFAVANRFAALVLLVPVYVGKNLVGRLVIDPATGRSALRADVFVLVVGGACLVAALVAGAVQWGALGALDERYPGVAVAGLVLLAAAVVRGTATSLSMVCAARGRLAVWILSDLAATVASVVVCVVAVVLAPTDGAEPVLYHSVLVGAVVCALVRGASLARRPHSLNIDKE